MNNAEELKKIEQEILENKILPLAAAAKNLVFGKGNPEAKILFVGEAPGKFEDEQGLPFVGKAGKNLDNLLAKIGLTLNDVYIANILKYRPPENRDPNEEEIKSHTPYLIKQIKIIQPKVICSLGNFSTKFFLANGNADKMKEQPGITTLHGKVRVIEFQNHKIKLIPLFHPAAIIYNQHLKEEWEKDMAIVKREISQKELF